MNGYWITTGMIRISRWSSLKSSGTRAFGLCVLHQLGEQLLNLMLQLADRIATLLFAQVLHGPEADRLLPLRE